MKNKVNILFRWLDYNHYTISYLIGILDESFAEDEIFIKIVHNLSEIKQTLSDTYSTNILAYSFTTPEYVPIKKEISNLKSILKDGITIICGGPHATAMPESLIEAGADAVFTGESEESLKAYLSDILKGAGVKKGIIKPLKLEIFDSYPPFAYKRNLFGPIELRRGCANRCSFCQTPSLSSKIRERSVDNVLYFASFIKKDGKKRIFFTIPDALLYGSKNGRINTKAIENLLSGLQEMGMETHLGNFPSEVSPEKVSEYPEGLSILRKYVKNKDILIGAQSGSEKVLKLMKRKHNLKNIIRSVEISCMEGFKPIVDFILCTPGETKQDRIETLKFMKMLSKRYSVRINLHHFLPLPGTSYWGKLPERIENTILNEVRKMKDNGIVTGNFFSQIEYSSSIERTNF